MLVSSQKNSHENIQNEIENWVGYGFGFYTIRASSIGNTATQTFFQNKPHFLSLCCWVEN
jgi:hypothetical protein